MIKTCFHIILLAFVTCTFAQEDFKPFEMHKDRVIIHPALAFKTAPFSLKSNFSKDINKIKYRPNLNTIGGIGFHYKWIGVNINFKLPGYLRNVDKFGKTEYIDIGASFPFKGWFFALNLHNYRGFAVKDANLINPSFGNENSNNLIQNSTANASFKISAWKFFNKDFQVKPALGIAGRYLSQAYSFYLKPTFNIHGVENPNAIIPYQYFDTTNTKFRATNLNAIDLGAVPGFAYVNNYKGWQYGGWAGIGGVIQAKYFKTDDVARGFLGLSPRIDLNLSAGYNIEDWFLMLNASYDNKRIKFNELRYRQSYYSLSLVGGYRFKYKTVKNQIN